MSKSSVVSTAYFQNGVVVINITVFLLLFLNACVSRPEGAPSGGVPPSPLFGVLNKSEGTQEFVYFSRGQEVDNLDKTTSWARLDFQRPTLVALTRRDGIAVKSFHILPTSAKISGRIAGATLEFEVDRPRQLAVVLNEDWNNPCLIFVDPPPADLPNARRATVRRFGPGLHDVGEIRLVSNETVVFERGAYVRGRLVGENLHDVLIRGSGILSGESYGEKSKHLVELRNCSNITIDGLTLINSGFYNLVLPGKNNVARWLKLIGWRYSSDGIDIGENGLIEDCFIKVNDDSLKLYYNDITVRRCVIWQMENGAPFQMSWNLRKETHNVVVDDIDVVRCEHAHDWDSSAIFCAVHGGPGRLHHYLFRNIRIENSNWRLISLLSKPSEWSKGLNPGSIYRLVFRDISAPDSFRLPSRIKGWEPTGGMIENVAFENFRIGGRLIKNLAGANLQVDWRTVQFISFDGAEVPEPLTRR